MPKLQAKTRRICVLGVILLCCVGAMVGRYDVIGMGICGLLALVKDDKDEE